MKDFFKLFRRYIEGEQTEVSWNKIEPLPPEVVCAHNVDTYNYMECVLFALQTSLHFMCML